MKMGEFMKKIKKFNSDIIFKIAIFLLPFENFFFAPSSGWATLSPIILFIYMLLNYKLLFNNIIKYRKFIYIFLFSLVLCLANYLFAGFNIIRTINSLIPIGLGFTIFCSFDIYYKKNHSIKDLIKVILISYTISLFVGFLQYFVIKFNIKILYEFFDLLFKRNYLDNNRVQYFFTEPSFIGMHLFGILLPVYFLTKEKKILYLIVAFGLSAIFFKSGVRILLDILVVIGIMFLIYLIKNKKYKLLALLPIILLLSFFYMYNSNYRVKQIIDKGIHADGSLATRYFRIQSSVYGYLENPRQALFGYGLGNSIIPLRDGYDRAIKEYESSYVSEVYGLDNKDFNDDAASYCLYIRFISEFGLILFFVALYYMFKITKNSNFEYKYSYLFITLYLYLQFESYAFYSLWLFILVMINTQKKVSLNNNVLIGYIGAGDNSGIDSYLLNFLSVVKSNNNNNNKIDFLTKKYSDKMFKKLNKYGSQLFSVSKNKHPIRQFLEMKKIIKNGKYDIVYFNISETYNFVGVLSAKLLGVKHIIVHSHSSGVDNVSKLRRNMCSLLNLLCKPIIHICSDKKLACSKFAAKWMFTKNVVNKGKYELIYNAIDNNKFTKNVKNRYKIRKKYGINDELVLCHIGRFCYQKNHKFLLLVFKELLKIKKDAKLICVGDGKLFDEIINYASELKINNNVIFTGIVNNVNEIMQASDIFLLPSIFEGLPIVGVEAQFTLLPCLFSSNITDEVIISNNATLLHIDNTSKWVNEIINRSKLPNTLLKESDKFILSNIEQQYFNIINKF